MERDTLRYEALKQWILEHRIVTHHKISIGARPYVERADFYGTTFDDAVDSLLNDRAHKVGADTQRAGAGVPLNDAADQAPKAEDLELGDQGQSGG